MLIYISILCILIVEILWIIKSKSIEYFEYPFDSVQNESNKSSSVNSILNNKVQRLILENDSKHCKHISQDNSVSKSVDILNNYRLLTHPKIDNSCYLKMSDTLVNGRCSRLNGNLYSDDYS
ncbi:hypothetical protein EBU71_21640, partial [bacterium]|nr:hypothetical protein [Candidatus Elulimicrobium humile]